MTVDFSTIKQLFDRLSNKFETTFLIKSKTSIFTKRFNTPLVLNPEYTYKAAVTLFTVYNTPQLINSENNQFTYSKDGGISFKTVTFPNGVYTYDQMNEKIKALLTAQGDWVDTAIVVGIDEASSKFTISLKAGYQVDFTTANSLRIILGFNSRVLTATTNLGDSIGNIENDISTINVQADFVRGGYVEDVNNGLVRQGIILTIPAFSVVPNAKIIVEPARPIYYEINQVELRELSFKIVSQNIKVIDFGGQEIVIQVHIKQV